MKLAICADVLADLSYTDMLDKVKSLGIDAVEMTARRLAVARKHCNTAELLADEGKRKEFMGELREAQHAYFCSEHVLQSALAVQDRRGVPRSPCTTVLRWQVCWASRRSLPWLVCQATSTETDPELDHLYRFLAGLYGSGLRVPVEGNHRVLE